jgi:hypothetical protein
MINRHRHTEEVQICGDDCRYRKLYEGSQRSLTEMAARQAQAVSRVGRLRNQLVLAAKRAFPRAFGDAERAVGKRMSEVPDEVLVAYLESFMGSSILAEEPDGATDLRKALQEAGVPVPAGVDLSQWAEAVRAHAASMKDYQTPVLPITDNKPAANRTLLPNRSLLQPKQSPVVQDLDLEDLFGPDETKTQENPLQPQDNRSVSSGDTSAGLESNPATNLTPTKTQENPKEQDVEPGNEPLDTFDVNTVFDSDPLGERDSSDFDDDIFGDDLIPQNQTEGFGGFTDEATVITDDTDGGEFVDMSTNAEESGIDTQPQEGQPTESEKEIPTETKTEESPKQVLPGWAAGKTVKPQLFPAGGISPRVGKREKKTIKSRAIPADMLDIPISTTGGVPGELSDDLRQRLLSAASVARPVFTSDLAAMVGSEDVVNLWRNELQNGDLTVRFVLPKPRHKNRGSLVIPQAALAGVNGDFLKSHWARCMESYRGARIYELGVFFHRFGEQVISFESDGEAVVVRMSLPSGLTGAVLVAGQDLSVGGATRATVCTALEKLLQDRLVHVAVLVLNAEQFDLMAGIIEQEAKERGWRSNMPVTLSRSWEYVDGTGTAVPLLGV